VFQTFLTSFLVDPGYENQLTSLDEILDSGIELGYTDFMSIWFVVTSDLRHKEVVARGEIRSTVKVCTDRIRETANFATFAPVWKVRNYTNIITQKAQKVL
jgi:hypothetical protein